MTARLDHTMEKTDANGQPLKPDGEREQPRSHPYSLETPYGFHLDLDFLKYVDDIEKGNTIRRVHIHRKAKQPKFSTLPRNFSLPENGSRGCTSAPSKSWTATGAFSQRKASLGAEENPCPLLPNELTLTVGDEPSYRRKALLAETWRQAELGWQEGELRGRPQLLRASSMPAALPPGHPPQGDKRVPSPLRPPSQHYHDQSGSESTFHPALRSPSSNGIVLNVPREMSLEQDASLGQKEHLEGGSLGLVQIQPPWQSQHPAALQLQVVMESGGEEGDAANGTGCSTLAGSEPTLPGVLLQLTEENMNPGEGELSVSAIAPKVLKKVEERSVQAGENKENCGAQPLGAGEPGEVATLKQQITVLEEQLSKKKEELEQIRAVVEQQDHEIKEKEKSIKLLASSKAQLEEKLRWENTKEAKPLSRQSSAALQYYNAAVNTDLSQVTVAKQAHDKGINVNIPVFTKSIGCCVCRAESMNAQVKVGAQTDQGLADAGTGVSGEGPGRFGEADVDAGLHALCCTQLKIDEHLTDDNQNHRNNYDTQSLAAHTVTAESCQRTRIGLNAEENKAGFGEDNPQDRLEEEGPPDHEDLPTVDPIGQYVKKIQELLQEQWLCLEHGYPELASAIKQPASKLSSIQNQLVNSLNSLLSAYSTQGPVDKENSNTHYQQLEISPTTSLKSIMKKKGFHAGGNGTKKNLQFVGVNGGYETTSSEDTSCEDSPSDGDVESEMERRANDLEITLVKAGGESEGASSGTSLQERRKDDDVVEPLAEAVPCTQQKADRCKPSEDFLADCQLLSKHLSEIRTSNDKHLRHVLSIVCQEWFQVSSHKTSSPEVVAVYLKALEAIQPQLLEMVVNLADGNGNTALHYSVSHSNFPIAKLLLDTGVCCLDLQNRAGYTAVMLTPLATAETGEDMEVVMKLLKEGDVNLRAAQGGQTALMLGVSHERDDMVRALLSCQADVNLQDEEGMTALMLACQLGNTDIVRLLLAQPGCNVALTDKSGNSALSLAQHAACGDIVALLRAHAE
ncbi:KN motif and ankyrin repeat domain-containing protein 4 isoform X2 [Cuculus canorus]|uniref:KN motif and ankyrin repeat domain-containing protein 4 isoform X2 n=1 Tax=Cuculus canorus TaxID=55661 RepID=UPI0023AB2ABA|nr:KN motif and ankyrin repeat domain-containing protein 4 isoform X2 [Cuculus canorus]